MNFKELKHQLKAMNKSQLRHLFELAELEETEKWFSIFYL